MKWPDDPLVRFFLKIYLVIWVLFHRKEVRLLEQQARIKAEKYFLFDLPNETHSSNRVHHR